MRQKVKFGNEGADGVAVLLTMMMVMQKHGSRFDSYEQNEHMLGTDRVGRRYLIRGRNRTSIDIVGQIRCG